MTSRLRGQRPFAPISPNIITAQPDHSSKPIHAGTLMENRITHYGESDTQEGSFDLLDDRSSDSSFERRMLQEMKMEREIAVATRREQPRPFSKAKRPLRTKITAAQLERKTLPNPSEPVEEYGTSSGDARGDEERTPGLNVPRTWGSKARRTPSFLDRYNQSLQSLTPVVGGSDPIDWSVAAANVALPSTEDSPLSRKSSARGTPASEQRQQSSLDKILSWDVSGDFSTNSLITSTPAASRMNPRLREVRQAEIDAARQFPTPPSKEPEFAASAKGVISSEIQTGKRTEQSAGSATRYNGEPEPEARLSRPIHARQDSRDLLRRLSRSVSGTPSPGRAASKPTAPSSEVQKPTAVTATSPTHREGISEKKDGFEQIEESSRLAQEPFKSTLKRKLMEEPSSSSNQQPNAAPLREASVQKSISGSVPKTPVVTGAWIDTPAPKRPHEQDDKKAKRKSNISAQDRSLSSTENKGTEKGKQPERPAPKLPRSALSAIIEHAKTSFYGNTNDDIGEATIQSLEGVIDPGNRDLDDSIVNNAIALPEGMRPTEEDKLAIREILEQRIVADLPFSDGLPPTPEERVLIREIIEKRMKRGMRKRLPINSPSLEKLEEDAEEQETEVPLTPRRRDRLLEDIQLQRMSDQVSSMHNRTRSLNAGLGRIERVISGSSSCQHCGCPGSRSGHASHTISSFAKSINAAFYQKEGDKGKLTWLGWMSAIFLLWAVAEAIMCWQFCKPVYEEQMDGFGIYKDMPEPPFVLVNTAFGPFGSALSVPWNFALGLFRWMWEFLWYILESDEAQEGYTTASKVVSTVISQAAAETDWGSMDADEVL